MSHDAENPSPDRPLNHLAGSSSPYLLLHRHNPVDWYPWGPEALEKARREDKPIFLSVGYSTCYWCHVMERESFSDPDIAERLAEGFVSIKVDREERPDLDEIYMTATQLLTQRGGWPNSVFLTPGLKPFYAGTYFPPEGRHGLPGFATVLDSLAGAWRDRRRDVEAQAEEMSLAMGKALEQRDRPSAEPPGPQVAEAAAASLVRRFDDQWGGFGDAPKFPSPSNLYLLLELADEDAQAARMLHHTLDEMARGGLYDQLGGGFHRYATDRRWRIPHFEKMLYDNGFLLELYALEHERTGDPEAARVARETAVFLAREMTGDHGAFLSAIDAETDGFEGAFYVWTAKELLDVLGEENTAFLAPLYGFDGPPFFEDDHYVLHLPRPLAEAAERRKTTRKALLAEMAPLRQKLFAARAERKRPLTDDKVLADWNGIAVTGMAVAGRVLGEEELIHRAEEAARFVLRELSADTLLHVWRDGSARLPAFLADYAFMIRGLLALDEAARELGRPSDDGRGGDWLSAAVALADEQVARLRSPDGGFYNAAADDDLLFRPRDTMDGALPAANAVSALNFLALAQRLEGPAGERWRREAADTLRSFGGLIEAYPDAVRMAAVAARRLAASGDGESGAETAAARIPGRGPVGAGAPDGAPGAVDRLGRVAREVVHGTARRLDRDDREGGRFELTLEIADGWHLYAPPASHPDLVVTRVEGQDVEYPPGRDFEGVAVYDGTVTLTGRLPEGRHKVRLTYQACDAGSCLPAVVRDIAVTD